jgi:hypothetical protein
VAAVAVDKLSAQMEFLSVAVTSLTSVPGVLGVQVLLVPHQVESRVETAISISAHRFLLRLVEMVAAEDTQHHFLQADIPAVVARSTTLHTQQRRIQTLVAAVLLLMAEPVESQVQVVVALVDQVIRLEMALA